MRDCAYSGANARRRPMSTEKPATKDDPKARAQGPVGELPPDQELSDEQLDAVSGGSGTPTVSEIVVTKQTDGASASLFRAADVGVGNTSLAQVADAVTIPLPK